MSNVSYLMALLGPVYLVAGLSILIYTKPWVELIKGFEKDHFTMMAMSWVSLVFGLIIIQMYNVWAWNGALLVTITGWAAFAKGVFYFLAPGNWIRTVLRWHECVNCLIFHGVVAVVIGGYLSYVAYLAV